ncbi:MAG TPA: hypothetical protein PLO65_12645 [Caulobacter sp.]|nr:hypothetical protein [Caulobacter sp.]
MLFLMNDVVLNLDALELAPPVAARRFARLSHGFIDRLGAELFSEDPLLQRRDVERAQRLAALIMAKTPEVNAALFVAPSAGCPVDHVQSRYCQIGLEVMGLLYERQKHGTLTTVEADRQVWRRLAA